MPQGLDPLLQHARTAPIAEWGREFERHIREELSRILASDPFKASPKSQDFLRHLVELALQGRTDELKERCIGVALFGRDPGYDTTTDSVVRVAAKGVRSRLDAFYRAGRRGKVRISMPSGVYVPQFHAAEIAQPDARAPASAFAPSTAGKASQAWLRWRAWVLSGGSVVIAILIFLAGARYSEHPAAPGTVEPPWPLSRVIDDSHRTTLVMADSDLGLLGMLTKRRISLEEYLNPAYPANVLDRANSSAWTSKTVGVFTQAPHTALADFSMALRLGVLSGRLGSRIESKWPRRVQLSDLRDGNWILLGSPSSDPWVSVFEGRLNFVERPSLPDSRAFVNRSPLPGEQRRYESFVWAGLTGEEYATIALLPTETSHGSILIIQGLHQEGTDAACAFVSSESGREKILDALRARRADPRTAWFEMLVRSRSIARSGSSADIVAMRIHSPHPSVQTR